MMVKIIFQGCQDGSADVGYGRSENLGFHAMSYAPTSNFSRDYAAAHSDAPASVSADGLLRFVTKGMALFLAGAAPWVIILKAFNLF